MIPGAPPVSVVSVAAIRSMPFCWKEMRGADGAERELGAGGQRAAVVAVAELDPGAGGALVEPQLRGAVVPEVDPQIGVLAAVLAAHGRADPLAAAELGRGHLDLRVLVAAVALGDPDVARRRVAVPTTCWETIDRPPSLIAAQPAPRPPSARLKSSEAEDVVDVVQVTATLVTFADATVPAPPDDAARLAARVAS